MTPLRIAWLLEDTDLAGGIRVAVAQADALMDRGHRTTLFTKGGPLTWRSSRAEWRYVEAWSEVRAEEFDFLIGTFWKTIPATYEIAGRRAIHLCQGYEGSFTAYAHMKDEIEAVYRLPIPKITVSPHLVEICRQYHPDATWIGQIVDDIFYRERQQSAGPPRVLLAGPAQADFKGIDIGYLAAQAARRAGADFDLIRVSQWPAVEGEPIETAAEFHVGLTSADMARLIAGCEVYLGPSRHQEGFGLPAAESMASGVPNILSEIPSFLSFHGHRDYALFVAEGDGAAMGSQLKRLLADSALRARLSRRGREVAEQFRAHHTALRLEQYFLGRR